jgi:nucleotide-binding universal stress UspA family protein
MWKILVPVDGSDGSARAVQHVIKIRTLVAPLDVHLLYVHVPPAPAGEDTPDPAVATAAAREAMSPAEAMLGAAAIPYTTAVASGFVGSTIAAYATEHGCDEIVMGTRGMGSTGQLLGSIARQVIQFADVPVTLVKSPRRVVVPVAAGTGGHLTGNQAA